MELAVRPAVPSDHARLAQIAAEGDFDDCESGYLSFIADVGRLLCATVDGDVVGFGGMVPVGSVAMTTDLFVANLSRGRGIGRHLLAKLLDGRPRRMTFSAQHPAALAAYQREGMEPRGRMLYLSGSATGSDTSLEPGAWLHGRDDLIAHFAAQGAVVTANAVFTANDSGLNDSGLNDSGLNDSGLEVLRVDTPNAIAECDRLLRAFEVGTAVRMYVPEPNPLADWLIARGFVVTDHDILCTTDGVVLPPTLAALHPGLA